MNGTTTFTKAFFTVAALFAFASPFMFSIDATEPQSTRFEGWPAQYQGKSLTQLPLTDKEAIFIRGFPGKIARFTDGTREMIIRWVEQPTRKLHPASDCYKGIGYHIQPLPIQINQQGIKMGCFNATKGASTQKVCEYIEAQDGQSWSDISSWYWGAVFDEQAAGWMSYVIAQ